MKIKDFYYDSDNKQDLVYARCWYPHHEPVGIVQVIHGMTEHTGRYEDLARFLTDHDFICVANDHLGHGKTVAKTRGFFGYKYGVDHLCKDVNTLRKRIYKDYPDLPYFFLGVSMGTFIERILISDSKVAEQLSGAIMAATAIDSPEIYKALDLINDRINDNGPKVVDVELSRQIFSNSSNAFANENDSLAWVTSNLGKREQYRNDSQSNFLFTNAGLRDLLTLLIEANKDSTIDATDPRLPLLFLSGKDDVLGDFGRAARKIAAKYLKGGTDDLSVKIFPKVRHDVLFDFPATQNLAFKTLESWLLPRLKNFRNIR